jgi:hypothetical protein
MSAEGQLQRSRDLAGVAAKRRLSVHRGYAAEQIFPALQPLHRLGH